MTFAVITIVPVVRGRRSEYLAFSERMAAVYRDHGALRITDHWQSDDPSDPADLHAEGTSYEPGALRGIADVAGASPSEAVVVTVTQWPSREARDRGNAAAARDPRVTATLEEEPVFDGGRVVGDGFEVAMDLNSGRPDRPAP